MTAKYFCDCCGKEITGENKVFTSAELRGGTTTRLRLLEPKSKMIVEVTTGIQKDDSQNYNTGDWCKYCIIDTINLADDRVRAFEKVNVAFSL